MSASVVIFVTPFLKNYIEETLSGFPQANEFSLSYYKNFKNLTALYKSLPKTVQGVVVPSSIPARMLKLYFPDHAVPIYAFDNDNAGIYKLFLELLNKDRALKMERVFADMFEFMRLKQDSFLFGAYAGNLSELMQARVSEMSFDELVAVGELYADKHIELWQNGQIDVSVTRFSLIMERLRHTGLNVRFAYPDISFTRNVLTSVLQEATIKGLTDNLPCSVLITLRRNTNLEGDKLKRKVNELGKYVGMFADEMKLSYHLQKREYGLEIFTNHKTVAIITEDFKTCRLRSFLSGRLDLNFDIGYGIGLGLYQAHVNAMDAAREAYNLPAAATCLKNEHYELIVLAGGDKQPVDSCRYSNMVKQLAKDSALPCPIVQRIISKASELSADNITPEELSHKLSLTKRSASHFLSVLHKSGLATIVGKKQTASRGRPEYIYKLKLDAHA